MSDSPDPHLLASAALDHEVTDDERAQVEASAELSAELASYRLLRDRLVDVDVPAADRESGVAAALAAFDAIAPAEPASTSSPLADVVPMRARRQRQQRWLGGAVAAAFVGLLGVAVISSRGGDDDRSTADNSVVLRTAESDASSKTGTPDAETSDEVAGAVSAADSADQSADAGSESAETTADDTSDATTSDDDTSDDDTSAQLPAAAPVATTTPAAAATTAGEAAPTAGGSVDPWAGASVFTTEDELRSYADEPGSPLAVSTFATVEGSADTTADTTADSAASDTAQSTAGSTPGAATDTTESLDDVVLDPAYRVCETGGLATAAVIYQGRRVLVVRDDAAGELRIIAPETCAVTSRIPLL